jgi:hypothetical protein
MFNELDELLKLTKMVEATSTNTDTEVPEEDLPATVRAYDDGDYSGKFTALTTKSAPAEPVEDDVPQKPTDGKAYGSSGNATFTDKHGKAVENGPLFEEDGPTMLPESEEEVAEPAPEVDDTAMEQSMDATQAATEELADAVKDMTDDEPNGAQADTEASMLGKSLNRGLKGGLSPFSESVEKGMGREFTHKYMLENSAGFNFRQDEPFKLGDVVQANGIPVLFVVKDNDGTMIKTAKPTGCACDFAKGKDGVWPEFCFDQSDLTKMDNASLNQADDLCAFNDRDIAMRGFDGRCVDPAPMELAQEFARKQTMEDISDNLDQILGAYRNAAAGNDKEFCYATATPTTTYVLPSGEVTTKAISGGYCCRN